jgi:uncharacterized protein (DUF1800 family)
VLTPLPGSKWNYEKAAHLLNRAAFGGTPAQIESAHGRGLDSILRELLDSPYERDHMVPPPEWAHPRNIRAIRMALQALKEDAPERKNQMREMREMEVAQALDLRRWWLNRMITTQNPLREKMTLFWHGHFATSIEKVKDGYWMWLQNETLRSNAFGNFKSLTKLMSCDPAMMTYLDLQESRKEHPNENWARELMELFTVGIGQYSEEDIRESARAFTGYRLDMTTQQFQFAPGQHDQTQKTFMGRTGGWSGDDVIDILLERPACAEFIARKIWRYFVEDEPSQKTIGAVASQLRAQRYEIRPVLREIFTSTEFFSESAMHSMVKSPTQFLVQTCKLLETDLPPAKVAQNAMGQMGQLLFGPPNVKGWDGGRAWVSSSTLLFRYNFANYLVNGDPPRPAADALKQNVTVPAVSPPTIVETRREPIDVGRIVPRELRDKPEELVAHLEKRFFQRELPHKQSEIFTQFLLARKPGTSDETIRLLLHLMMSTPEFQLT